MDGLNYIWIRRIRLKWDLRRNDGAKEAKFGLFSRLTLGGIQAFVVKYCETPWQLIPITTLLHI